MKAIILLVMVTLAIIHASPASWASLGVSSDLRIGFWKSVGVTSPEIAKIWIKEVGVSPDSAYELKKWKEQFNITDPYEAAKWVKATGYSNPDLIIEQWVKKGIKTVENAQLCHKYDAVIKVSNSSSKQNKRIKYNPNGCAERLAKDNIGAFIKPLSKKECLDKGFIWKFTIDNEWVCYASEEADKLAIEKDKLAKLAKIESDRLAKEKAEIDRLAKIEHDKKVATSSTYAGIKMYSYLKENKQISSYEFEFVGMKGKVEVNNNTEIIEIMLNIRDPKIMDKIEKSLQKKYTYVDTIDYTDMTGKTSRDLVLQILTQQIGVDTIYKHGEDKIILKDTSTDKQGMNSIVVYNTLRYISKEKLDNLREEARKKNEAAKKKDEELDSI